jgi:hypothetical protein
MAFLSAEVHSSHHKSRSNLIAFQHAVEGLAELGAYAGDNEVMFGFSGNDIVSLSANAAPFKSGALCMVQRVFRQTILLDDVIGSMPLLRLKLLHACDQWHSPRMCPASYRSHRKLRP